LFFSDGVYLPLKRGFEFVGLNLPGSCKKPETRDCVLYYGDTIVQQPAKFESMTEDLVNDWRAFVEKWDENKENPFFFYLSFPKMPIASQMFRGSSKNGKLRNDQAMLTKFLGPRGDSINELGFAVGEVMSDLQKLGIAEETLIIFMSNRGSSGSGKCLLP
jgi:arylsulfatase A